MLEAFTRAVIRRRVVVVILWALLAVGGLVSSTRLPGLLSTSLAVPGTSSEEANAILTRHFGENTEGTFTVVLPETKAAPATVTAFHRTLVAAARSVPTGRASALQRGDGIVYGDIGTSLDLQQAASYTAAIRNALHAARVPDAYVTGPPALQDDITPVLASDLRAGEIIAVIAAVLLLSFALGVSAAALVPLVVALCTTTAALAVIYGLAHWFLMVLYIPNLVRLIGLGLAVDYSLLILSRFKEELAHGSRTVRDAIASTLSTSGRTVLVSGVAVGVGLSVLLIVPVPFVRSLGVAGLLVPILSVVAALTLAPALLSYLGDAVTHHPGRYWLGARAGPANGSWARTARLVVRRPLLSLAGALAVLVAAAIPAAWLQLTPASVTAIPHNLESARGLALMRDRAGPGVLTPIEIVVDSGVPAGAVAPAVSAATLRLAHEVLAQPDVFVVAIGSRPPYVDASGRYGRAIVVERDDFGAGASQRLVQHIRSQLVPAARFPARARVYLGGAAAQGADFLARTYGTFPWVVLLVAASAYVLLLRAFRSLLLPLMAVALDALSVAASYGLTVLFFRFGVGAGSFGLYHVSQLEGWVPLFMFAMLFGLSMDYEVFFVSRMRESRDKGSDTQTAIVDGMSQTGRVVTVAALVMVGALAGLVAGRIAALQELGTGLALGVLIDATVVRGLLMPSLMAVAGRWNWWLPPAVAHLVHVEASPLAGRQRGDFTMTPEPVSTSRR